MGGVRAQGEAPLPHGVELKLYRATEHIADLARVYRQFVDEKPFGLQFVERDPSTGEHVVRVRLRDGAEVPGKVSAVIGDIAHNLRSALDVMVCELARSRGATIGRQQFPIAKGPYIDRTASRDLLRRALMQERKRARHRQWFKELTDGIPDAAAESIRRMGVHRSFRPKHPLWVALQNLHEVSRLDKHQFVVDVGGEGHWGPQKATDGALLFRFYPLVDGAEIYRSADPPPSAIVDRQAVHLCFRKPEAVEGITVGFWADDALRAVQKTCSGLARFLPNDQ